MRFKSRHLTRVSQLFRLVCRLALDVKILSEVGTSANCGPPFLFANLIPYRKYLR